RRGRAMLHADGDWSTAFGNVPGRGHAEGPDISILLEVKVEVAVAEVTEAPSRHSQILTRHSSVNGGLHRTKVREEFDREGPAHSEYLELVLHFWRREQQGCSPPLVGRTGDMKLFLLFEME